MSNSFFIDQSLRQPCRHLLQDRDAGVHRLMALGTERREIARRERQLRAFADLFDMVAVRLMCQLIATLALDPTTLSVGLGRDFTKIAPNPRIVDRDALASPFSQFALGKGFVVAIPEPLAERGQQPPAQLQDAYR